MSLHLYCCRTVSINDLKLSVSHDIVMSVKVSNAFCGGRSGDKTCKADDPFF